MYARGARAQERRREADGEPVIQIARSGDRAYRSLKFWPFPVGRVSSRGALAEFSNRLSVTIEKIINAKAQRGKATNPFCQDHASSLQIQQSDQSLANPAELVRC